jgi:hypothetical protein
MHGAKLLERPDVQNMVKETYVCNMYISLLVALVISVKIDPRLPHRRVNEPNRRLRLAT